MASTPNQTVITLGLVGVAVYFTVLLLRGAKAYLLYRRVRPTALTTWPLRRPAYVPFLVALGVVSAGLAVLSTVDGRPVSHVYSQAVTALYFVLMVPLAMRIEHGMYREGVWADTGFLPYGKIARLAFREAPEIELILVPRGRTTGSHRLRVPAREYGAVRKILEEMIREQAVRTEKPILGL